MKTTMTAVLCTFAMLSACETQVKPQARDGPPATAQPIVSSESPSQAAPPAGFSATVNRYCPVMQKNQLGTYTMTEHTAQFDGKTVGFCCDDCPEAWQVMTDEQRRASLEAVQAKK